jgi:hypothetical protein
MAYLSPSQLQIPLSRQICGHLRSGATTQDDAAIHRGQLLYIYALLRSRLKCIPPHQSIEMTTAEQKDRAKPMNQRLVAFTFSPVDISFGSRLASKSISHQAVVVRDPTRQGGLVIELSNTDGVQYTTRPATANDLVNEPIGFTDKSDSDITQLGTKHCYGFNLDLTTTECASRCMGKKAP